MGLYDRFTSKNDANVSIVYTKGVIGRGRITIIKGTGEGTSITVDSLNPVRVGRMAKKCELVIPSVNVSRIHCIVEYNENRKNFLVTDCSMNGTFINGERLPKNIGVLFKTGTILCLANEEHKIELI